MRPLRSTSPSAANEAGSAPARLNNSSRTERVWAGRCRVTRIVAGNVAGRFFARKISASTPPAEVPMATISRLAIQCLLSGMPIAETARKRGGSRQGVTSKGGPNAFARSRFQPPANQFIRNSRRRSTYCLHHWQQPEPRRRWLRDRRAPAFQAEHTMVQDLTRQNLLEEAELTERHLVQSEVTIAEQRKRVAWQERLGRDSVRSMELLATYLRVRASHIAHHDSLILELGQNTIALKRRSNPRQ